MKNVLLYGDYSCVHWTLAQGLLKTGVSVKVASSGDGWKNYPRNINLKAKSRFEKIRVLGKHFYSSDFKQYDVIQLIGYSPFVKWHKLSKIIIQHLKKKNKRMFLGAFGCDYYWMYACMNKMFDYSFIDSKYNNKEIFNQEKCAKNNIDRHYSYKAFLLNQYVAQICNGIIAGAYDYWFAYKNTDFYNKLKYIPFPINTDEIHYYPNVINNNKVVFLIGVQKDRFYWKGLNLVCPILEDFKKKYPKDIDIIYIENIPYNEYQKVLDKVNVVVDQVYSMSHGMNALTSLAKGKVVLSGAEDCHYSLIREENNKPIINISPNNQQIKHQIENIIDSRGNIELMGLNGRKYIEKHHDYILVAKKYIEAWGGV